jgi:predicted MFS family arabinose efflux permease
MITLVGVSSLFGTSYVVLLPAFAADVLRAGEAGLGALNSAIGGGALAGSLTVASFGRFRRKGLLLTIGSLLFPIGVILFSLSRALPLSMAALAVVGWSVVTQNATINTLIQSMCPDELRGRVMAVFTLMIFGATPFGSLLAGSVGQAFGPTVGVSLGGAVALLYALSVLVMMPPLRRLQR